MTWTRTEENRYECNTNNWKFLIITDPKTNNNFLFDCSLNKLLNTTQDVSECFFQAFCLNLMAERRKGKNE